MQFSIQEQEPVGYAKSYTEYVDGDIAGGGLMFDEVGIIKHSDEWFPLYAAPIPEEK